MSDVESGVLAAALLPFCPAAALVGPLVVGRTFESTELGPKRWTTMPEGFGLGCGPAKARPAQRLAPININNLLFFKDFLRRAACPIRSGIALSPRRCKSRAAAVFLASRERQKSGMKRL